MKLPRVTDHAVLRYLERVKRIDVAAIRQHIAQQYAPAATVGALSIIAEGVCFQLDRTAATVVSVTPYTKGSPCKTKRRQIGEARP